MKNCVYIVIVLMGLVIAQGSSLYEQVIKNFNGNDNEEKKAQKVSRDISKLTYDTSDLEIKDNENALEPISVGDERKRVEEYTLLLGFLNPWLGVGAALHYLKVNKLIEVDKDGHIPHTKDTLGNLQDITLTVIQIPFSSDVAGDIKAITPEIKSVVNDLKGLVNCHDYTCTIYVVGLNITAGYDPVRIGVFLSIEFFEFSILNEKISLTGFRYCEPIELPLKKVKICIEVSEMELSEERACLNLGFTVLFFSHTFPDLCIFGSRKSTT